MSELHTTDTVTDPVAAALNAAFRAEQATGAIGHTLTLNAQVLAIQRAARLRYDREITTPRREIWEGILGTVGAELPSDVRKSTTKEGNTSAEFLWRYQKLQHDPLSQRELRVTGEVSARYDCFSWEEELPLAIGYLASGLSPDVFENCKVPNVLLGVSALGSRKKKRLPADFLFGSVVESLSDREAKKLSVTLTAHGTGIGSRPLLQAATERHQLQSGSISEYYLQPEYVDSIYEDLRRGCSGENYTWEPIANPTPQDAEAFLDKKYFQAGIGEDFKKLQSVYAWLETAPFVPRQLNVGE